MKNYSTKAYYAYAKRMLEGDAGQVNVPDKSDDPQFKKMIIGASAGGVGAVACLKYLDNVFSMSSLNNTISEFTKYSMSVSSRASLAAKNSAVAAPSLWHKILGVFKGLIAKALGWVQTFCGRMLKGFPELSKPVFGDGAATIGSKVPTYGSVLCMALVGAAVGAVIYRIYKFVRNRRKKTESVAAFNARKNREYKAILVETVAFFDGLERLTELSGDDVKTTVVGKGSNQLTRTTYGGKITKVPELDKTERMLKMSKDNAAYAIKKQGANPNGYVSTSSLREPTGTVTKAGTTAVKEAPAKAEGFLNSMKDRLMAMWTSVKTWCSANPVLATMVGICAALVACWYGVKKYKEHQAKKAGAAQTA